MLTEMNLAGLPPFDPRLALSIRDAVRAKLLNVDGKRASLQATQRWANKFRGGFRPFPGGPKLVLPTVRVEGELMTTAAWCVAWLKAIEEARRAQGGSKP